MKKIKILITGSLGFIFSNLIRKIVYENYPYTIVSLDNISRKNHINSVYVNRGHQFHIGDITDENFIDNILTLESPDIVIHAAANTFVDDSIRDPLQFVKTNVVGTQVLLNASIKHKVKKFVYISTDEVYGHLTSESEPSWDESASLDPRNPYAASKAAGELLVRAAHETFGLPYIITRASNNYGPRQTVEKFIPKIIKCILNNEPIPIYGQGNQIRDWTHVFDNCSAVLKILSSGKDNQVYNISSNQEFSNLEVVHEICKLMEKGQDLISFVPDRPGHDFRYSTSSTKLKSLGWMPNYKFKKGGLAHCVEWYLDNKYYLNM